MPRQAVAGMLAVALSGSAAASAQGRFTPARYISGVLPTAPALAVSGGEVFLEVHVADDGHVDGVRQLRTTAGFTGAVVDAVRLWRFTPATDVVASSAIEGPGTAISVAASVLIAALFVPPTLNGPTLGQPARDLASPSSDTPTVITAGEARYPPLAVGVGSVLVEVDRRRGRCLRHARRRFIAGVRRRRARGGAVVVVFGRAPKRRRGDGSCISAVRVPAAGHRRAMSWRLLGDHRPCRGPCQSGGVACHVTRSEWCAPLEGARNTTRPST